MKIIATIKRSAGNDSVGDMWQETKSFNSSDPIEKIFQWYQFVVRQSALEWKYCTQANIILPINQEIMTQEFLEMINDGLKFWKRRKISTKAKK